MCFWLWGKYSLVQLPEEPSIIWTVDAIYFSGQQLSFSNVFADKCFINKAQFDAGFAHRLILKDGAVPAIKDPHDSELQTVNDTASNVCVFLVITLKCSSLFSSSHGAPPGAQLFSERIVKLYLSFINMIQLKTFCRMKDAVLLYRYSRLTWDWVKLCV